MAKGQGPLAITLAAVIFLVAMMFIFGGDIESTRDVEETTLLSVSSIGTVGEGNLALRHIYLGNTYITYKPVSGAKLKEDGPWTVARGVLTLQEHEIRFSSEESEFDAISAGSLSFHVVDTNKYGALIVQLNDRVIWSGTPEVNDIVQIDMNPFRNLLVDGQNTIKISAAGSGWRIWAPTVYVFDDLQLSERTYEKASKDFEFTLSPSEVANWEVGRVVFKLDSADNADDLMIKVNDAIVFRGRPSPKEISYTVDFSSVIANVQSGKNTLSLEAGKSASYDIKELEIIVFTSAESRTEVFDFDISEEQISAMRNGGLVGEISFEVSGVEESGPLVVLYAGEQETVLLERNLNKGTKKLSFTDAEAVEGKNTLLFRSFGVYKLKGLEVKLVKR